MQTAIQEAEQSDTTVAQGDRQHVLPAWLTKMFATIDAFDVDTFLTFLSPKCEFRFGNAPSPYGHEAIRSAVASLFAAIKGIVHNDLEEARHVAPRFFPAFQYHPVG